MTFRNKAITVRLLQCNRALWFFRRIWKISYDANDKRAAFGGLGPGAGRANGGSAASASAQTGAVCHDLGEVGRHEQAEAVGGFGSASAHLGSDHGNDAQGMECGQAQMGGREGQLAGLQPASRY
jgi:hypothetical protein